MRFVWFSLSLTWFSEDIDTVRDIRSGSGSSVEILLFTFWSKAVFFECCPPHFDHTTKHLLRKMVKEIIFFFKEKKTNKLNQNLREFNWIKRAASLVLKDARTSRFILSCPTSSSFFFFFLKTKIINKSWFIC